MGIQLRSGVENALTSAAAGGAGSGEVLGKVLLAICFTGGEKDAPSPGPVPNITPASVLLLEGATPDILKEDRLILSGGDVYTGDVVCGKVPWVPAPL